MNINSKNKISKIIYLIDNHIIKILNRKEVDEDKLDSLTDIRILYVEELNSLISSNNTSEMFDKKYWKSYRKSNL